MRDMRNGGERVYRGTLPLAEWSDEAYGDQRAEGEFRLGYVIGLIYPSLTGSHHILRRTPKLTRELAQSSLGDEVCALS